MTQVLASLLGLGLLMALLPLASLVFILGSARRGKGPKQHLVYTLKVMMKKRLRRGKHLPEHTRQISVGLVLVLYLDASP